jgi:septum formation protein
MIPSGTRVYLASQSPRRRELLRQIGVGFEMLVLREHRDRGPDVDEAPLAGERPDDYVRRVCLLKAQAGWKRLAERRLPSMPVLSADTTVCLGDVIYGKPTDADDARRMLSTLSGTEHRVLTAVAIQSGTRAELAVSESLVRFRELSVQDIDAYVATGEPFDKAGAYGIQGHAATFIPEIRGSYTGIMGLPLYETAMLLERILRQGCGVNEA